MSAGPAAGLHPRLARLREKIHGHARSQPVSDGEKRQTAKRRFRQDDVSRRDAGRRQNQVCRRPRVGIGHQLCREPPDDPLPEPPRVGSEEPPLAIQCITLNPLRLDTLPLVSKNPTQLGC